MTSGICLPWGEAGLVVEWRGVRILLQVCYDLRFPVFARSRGDYDMILYVANWPTRALPYGIRFCGCAPSRTSVMLRA